MKGFWYRYAGPLDLTILLLCVVMDSSMGKTQPTHYRGDFAFYLIMGAVLAVVLLTIAGCSSLVAVTLRRDPFTPAQSEAFNIHFRLLAQSALTVALMGLAIFVGAFLGTEGFEGLQKSFIAVGLCQFFRHMAFLPKLWLGVPRFSQEVPE